MQFSFRPHDMPAREIWCPTSEAAQAFEGSCGVFSGIFGVDSGVGEPVDGHWVIDFDAFTPFITLAIDRFHNSRQGILRSLSLGLIATSLVLIDRAGRPLPGMPGPEQEKAWLALRDQHARAMPV